MNRDVLRILDANANRCREGLRVVEDVARFSLVKAREAALAKKLRHLVTQGIRLLGPGGRGLLDGRDAENDPGRKSFGPSERKRAGLKDILASNLHRAQEAARVLEEFGKLASPRAARCFKEARYGAYTLEKRLMSGRPSGARE